MEFNASNLTHAAQRQAFKVLIDGFLKHLNKQEDRTKTYTVTEPARRRLSG